ncbi:hypothetical protein BDY21DRAFT_366284 [Lineolata rhizophorae]|uniref:Uncharacterized protein n=1 Tax=Lineolata rhizophorae TaxID=578093 RepID=A0A6A6NSX5_9PEZI|nr:hypothetical protein BDY21DRAFT_366284 [Lineolata rhizophorae]
MSQERLPAMDPADNNRQTGSNTPDSKQAGEGAARVDRRKGGLRLPSRNSRIGKLLKEKPEEALQEVMQNAVLEMPPRVNGVFLPSDIRDQDDSGLLPLDLESGKVKLIPADTEEFPTQHNWRRPLEALHGSWGKLQDQQKLIVRFPKSGQRTLTGVSIEYRRMVVWAFHGYAEALEPVSFNSHRAKARQYRTPEEKVTLHWPKDYDKPPHWERVLSNISKETLERWKSPEWKAFRATCQKGDDILVRRTEFVNGKCCEYLQVFEYVLVRAKASETLQALLNVSSKF